MMMHVAAMAANQCVRAYSFRCLICASPVRQLMTGDAFVVPMMDALPPQHYSIECLRDIHCSPETRIVCVNVPIIINKSQHDDHNYLTAETNRKKIHQKWE